MTVELITIGAELLSGHTLNTNALACATRPQMFDRHRAVKKSVLGQVYIAQAAPPQVLQDLVLVSNKVAH